MSRAGLNFEEIVKAAESILANGQNPTIEKVRLALGGRGSNSTISKYLNEWRKDSLPSQLKNNNNYLTPPDPVNRAVAAVWQQLQEEKEAEINNIRTELESKIEELTRKNHELNKNFEEIVLERNDIINDNANLESKLTELKKQLEIEKKDHLIAKSTLDEVRNSLKLIEAEKETALNLQKQTYNESLSILDNNYEKNKQEYKLEIENLKEKIESSRHKFIVENDNLKIENTKLKQSFSVLEQEHSKLLIENKKLKDEFKNITEILTNINIKTDNIIHNSNNTNNLISNNFEKIENFNDRITTIITSQVISEKLLQDFSHTVITLKNDIESAKILITNQNKSNEVAKKEKK